MRAALAVGAVLLLAGCGGNVDQRPAAAPIQVDQPPPPITAVDEAAPPEVTDWFDFGDEDAGIDAGSGCGVGADIVVGSPDQPAVTTTTEWSDECQPLTAEELAEMRQQDREWRESVAPAPSTEARVLARLELRGGGDELFAAWRNRDGELCTDTSTDADDWQGDGPDGPCVHGNPMCAEICLAATYEGFPAQRHVVSGTVPAAAESVRITLAGGASRTYPSLGPVIPGTTRRIFMVELGSKNWRKFELVRDGAVTGTEEMPAMLARYEDCVEQIGAFPDGATEEGDWDEAAVQAYADEMRVCVTAGMPDAGWGGTIGSPPAVPVAPP